METSNRDLSISALRRQTRFELSALLNPIKFLTTDDGKLRYWAGLMSLCGIDAQYGPMIENDCDPTDKILSLWYERDPENSTISKLLSFLEELDRFDVIDETIGLIDGDINYFKLNPTIKKPNLTGDRYILTTDDVTRINEGLEPQRYDAFVLFADDDIDFATELIDTMEKQYGMKLCVKDRDLVGGGFEYETILRLITERCNRLIVILSKAFFESSANKFFLHFAQSVGIETSQRKLIPCRYKKECQPLPSYLTYYYILDYTRAGPLWNFWDKLRDAIKIVDVEKLERSHSEKTQSAKRTESNLRPILQQHSSSIGLKSVNHIKFNSMVNLNQLENEEIIPDNSLTPSTSATSLGSNSDSKRKKSWLKKFITKTKTKNEVVENGKEKRKFFNKHQKRKAAAAAV